MITNSLARYRGASKASEPFTPEDMEYGESVAKRALALLAQVAQVAQGETFEELGFFPGTECTVKDRQGHFANEMIKRGLTSGSCTLEELIEISHAIQRTPSSILIGEEELFMSEEITYEGKKVTLGDIFF